MVLGSRYLGSSLAILLATGLSKLGATEPPSGHLPQPQRRRFKSRSVRVGVGKRARQRRAARARALKMADDPFRETVEALTNWERKRWAGAGYPGLRTKNLEQLEAWLGRLEPRRRAA